LKIAVATRSNRAGGIETYLESVLSALSARGHDLSVWHEFPLASGDESFVPASIFTHALGADPMRGRPDVVFLHGLSDPTLEARLADSAPLVIFLHAYDAHASGTNPTASRTNSAAELGPGAWCAISAPLRRVEPSDDGQELRPPA
jgi:hypothetical protein